MPAKKATAPTAACRSQSEAITAALGGMMEAYSLLQTIHHALDSLGEVAAESETLGVAIRLLGRVHDELERHEHTTEERARLAVELSEEPADREALGADIAAARTAEESTP